MRICARIEQQPLVRSKRGVGAHRVLDDVQWAECRRFQGHLPRLDFRDVQHITDQLEQGRRRTLDCLQIGLLTQVQVGETE
ncbi:hypothetical protein D3C79_1050020 [compost metagenome]